MTSRHVLLGLLPPLLLAVYVCPVTADEKEDARFFEMKIRPAFVKHCYKCHSAKAKKLKAGLRLDHRGGWMRGGEHGPAIVPGKPDKSLLIKAIRYDDPDLKMPPNKKLPETLIKDFKRWVQMGAFDPRRSADSQATPSRDQNKPHWAFQPVRPVQVPNVKDPAWLATPIDAFVLAKLESREMRPATHAGKRSLLRRAYLDLIGLPPTLDEQKAYLNDPSPNAYEKLIDRLLKSPHYGERWARYWLDVVRYADSNGYERDAGKPSIWRYRDYVIDSLNKDKPYDRFVLEQIAGDELPDTSTETIIAMGYWALGSWQDEVDPLEQPQYRADELDDLVRTTSQTFLGITLGCARCHDHKFDPLTIEDYYRMVAIVDPLKRPNHGRRDSDRPAGTPAQLQQLKERDARLAEHRKAISHLKTQVEQNFVKAGQSALPAEVFQSFATPPKKRSKRQNSLVKQHQKKWAQELDAATPDATRKQITQHEAEIGKLYKETPDLIRAYYLFEPGPKAPLTYLLRRGNPAHRGPQVQPGVPAALVDKPREFLQPDQFTTRRRLTLARWIASPDNPVTARVIVNRVWQHHFGRGLVSTPSDFGTRGELPTHPDLLDWLVHWFVHEADWSLKKLHKLIMTSATYRMSTRGNTKAVQLDPENRLLARFPYRRLDAEAIRDSMLAASGKLDRKLHGPPVRFHIANVVIEGHTDKHKAWEN